MRREAQIFGWGNCLAARSKSNSGVSPAINATIGHWILKIHLISSGMIWDFRCSTNAPGKRRFANERRANASRIRHLWQQRASRCQPRLERTAGAKAGSCQRARRSPDRSCRWKDSTIRDCANFRCCAVLKSPKLIVTQQRARAIGIETSTPMALSLSRAADASGVLRARCRQQEPFHRGSRGCGLRCNGGHPARQAEFAACRQSSQRARRQSTMT